MLEDLGVAGGQQQALGLGQVARVDQLAERARHVELRELLAPEGAFWASQDAQSEGVEGKYFVWTKEQVDEVTGDAAAEVCRVFGVTEAGNWEGVTVLSLVAEAPETKSFAAARAALLAERQRRVPPGTDDKVLVSWNGLAIEALCAAQALDMLRPLRAGRGAEAARRALRRRIPHLDGDRVIAPDIERASELIESSTLRRASEKVVGTLD